MPPVPMHTFFAAVPYALAVWRARSARSRAVRKRRMAVRQLTQTLDGVLLTMGQAARAPRLDLPAFAAEHEAIDAAEARRIDADRAAGDIGEQTADENERFMVADRDTSGRETVARDVARAANQTVERSMPSGARSASVCARSSGSNAPG